MCKIPRLIGILEKTYLHSLTQHGGLSGISKKKRIYKRKGIWKIGRRRDTNYRINTGQGLGSQWKRDQSYNVWRFSSRGFSTIREYVPMILKVL